MKDAREPLNMGRRRRLVGREASTLYSRMEKYEYPVFVLVQLVDCYVHLAFKEILYRKRLVSLQHVSNILDIQGASTCKHRATNRLRIRSTLGRLP